MSEISKETGADGIRENAGPPSGDDVRDEVRLDLDEQSLDTWDDVRGDYALDPESDVARPALTESEDDDADADDENEASEDDEEDTEAENDEGDDFTDEEE